MWASRSRVATEPAAALLESDDRLALGVHVATVAEAAYGDGHDLDIDRYVQALDLNDWDPARAATDYDTSHEIEDLVEEHIKRGVAHELENPSHTPGRLPAPVLDRHAALAIELPLEEPVVTQNRVDR
jgi:hypothetical protein